MEGIKKAVIIVILALIIGGVVTFTKKNIKKDKVENWPSVEGTVLYSKIRIETKGLKERYFPFIGYKYTVDSKEYKGSTRGFWSSGYLNKTAAQSVIAKYTEGVKVTVHYDPENPAKSILPD